jgi:hypothetical protein
MGDRTEEELMSWRFSLLVAVYAILFALLWWTFGQPNLITCSPPVSRPEVCDRLVKVNDGPAWFIYEPWFFVAAFVAAVSVSWLALVRRYRS